MITNSNKKPLFILEMANNHMGDLSHAERIINECAEQVNKYRDCFDFAFKFQLRDWSIIHPAYKERNDIKMVKRLNDTRLTLEEFAKMKDIAKNAGFITMCTPFDEPSVQKVAELGFDILKIASCSCADWPLIEAIAKTDMPIIFSTGGAKLEDIDSMVTFFRNRKKDFAMMHCVGAYPTLNSQLQMNQIDLFKTRYPDVRVGFSTHEEPTNYDAVKIAVAKGCRIFERHVGIRTEKYSLNAYSSLPEQVGEWVKSAKAAFEMCGDEPSGRMSFSEKEICDLNDLYRGAYAKTDIKTGDVLSSDNIYYAMPIVNGQIASRNMSKYATYTAKKDFKKDEALMAADFEYTNERDAVAKIVKDMDKMLLEGNIALPDGIPMAISIHYGLENFYKYGTILFDVLNREYCKKILVMMPGQTHPTHYHKVKEETFHILNGVLEVDLDGIHYTLNKGDMLTILRGQKHSFWSDTGAIIEEISTTSVKGDSYYDDDKINNNPKRKIEQTYYHH